MPFWNPGGQHLSSKSSQAPSKRAGNLEDTQLDSLYALQAKLAQEHDVLGQIESIIRQLESDESNWLQLAHFVSSIAATLGNVIAKAEQSENATRPLELAHSLEELRERLLALYEKAGSLFEQVWDLPMEKWDKKTDTTRTAFATELSKQILSAYVNASSKKAIGFALKGAHWWVIAGMGQIPETRERYFNRALEMLEKVSDICEGELHDFIIRQKEAIAFAIGELEAYQDVYELVGVYPEALKEQIASYQTLIRKLEDREDWGLAANLAENIGNALTMNKLVEQSWEDERTALIRVFYSIAADAYLRQALMEQEHNLSNAVVARYQRAIWASKKGGDRDRTEQLEQDLAAMRR